MKRSSGVLMHITSLPGKYGIGTLGEQARRFADFCHDAGLAWWQILPIGPTGYGESPYQSDSVFAGNPNLIDLEALISQGLLTEKECDRYEWTDRDEDGKEILDKVSFVKVKKARNALLHQAYERAKKSSLAKEIQKFYVENKKWLKDYSLFLAIKEMQGGKAWNQWEKDFRDRDEKTLRNFQAEHRDEMEYHQFIQYLFYTQWAEFKSYCNRKGVKLIGDIPIYVAPDSCDVWANRTLFDCDAAGKLNRVAGCPPDYFSKTGQLWGNPLYDWKAMEACDFRWWIHRIKVMSQLFDLTRIDHFRGFAGYYAIPAGEPTAEFGTWLKGPGEKLFQALKKEIPHLALIAEDLGVITPDVEKLRDDFGFPGMKILQFAFSPTEESSYLPYNCPKRSVIYTGTHDNDTSRGWAFGISKEEWKMVKGYLGISDRRNAARAMIRAAWESPSELAIAPMQDFLQLPTEARMNTPSTVGNNWNWRMLPNAVDDKLIQWIRELNRSTWRIPVYQKTVKAKLLKKQ